MARLDEIRCKHTMPDGYQSDTALYTTKDFSSVGAVYEITDDGRLVELCPSWMDDFHGKPVDMNFQGTVNLSANGKTYSATFDLGNLQSITEARLAA